MNYFLIHIQYLGFRFHGWQHQPGVKTLESMIVKTLEFILGHRDFKILGTSRTDAMVSACHSAFELFMREDQEPGRLLDELNCNLPQDIRALRIERVGPEFNIINSPKTKTYHYYFTTGEKAHPFCAPFLTSFPHDLDIGAMKKGALLFEGTHDFRQYCTKPGPDTNFEREILESRIEENNELSAGFFPKSTWVYKVRSRGFMRNQVRLMMGQLVSLGRGETDLDRIKASLCPDGSTGGPLKRIAPASGLMLFHIEFHSIEDLVSKRREK